MSDDYRAGYEAGYFYGRTDAIKALPYDDRTPLAKREDTETETKGDGDHTQV